MLPPDRGRLPDCTCALNDKCRHVRTQRHTQYPERPIQTDYLFGTEAWRKKRTRVDVLNTDERIWDYSDHRPLVAEFDI